MHVIWRQFGFYFLYGAFLCTNFQRSVQGEKPKKYKVKISTKDEVGCKLSKRFVSVELDSVLLQRQWYGVHFDSRRLKNILTGLQPAYLRVGGNAANNLMYSPEVQGVQQNTMSPNLIQETFQTTLPPAIANGVTTTMTPQTLLTTQVFNVNQMQQTPKTIPTVAPQIVTTITTPPQGQYAETTIPQPFNQAQPAYTEATTAAYPTAQPNVQTTQPQQQQQQQPQQQQQQQPQQQQPQQQQPQQQQPQQQQQQQQQTTQQQQQQQQQGQNNNDQFNQAPMGQQQLPETPPTSGVQGAVTPPPYRQAKKLKSGKSKASGKKGKKSSKSKGTKEKQRHSRQLENEEIKVKSIDDEDKEDEDDNVEAENQSKREATVSQFSSQMFDKLVLFAQEAGVRLIFALNAFTRDQDGSLNTNNANQLIQFAARRGYQIDWELGNEPDKYKESGNNQKLSAEQVGQDFAKLRAIIDSATQGKSKLYGPDVSSPPTSLRFLQGFLKEGHAAVNAITWHHYYEEDKDVDLADYVNPNLLETFRKDAQSMYKVVKTTKTPLWIGESGDFADGGIPELSNSYAAGFMYLDKLGLAALYCNEVVIKNGLIGGNNAMLGKDFVPNPNYWIAFIFKQLVGSRVLYLGGSDKLLRLYAHCAERVHHSLPKGSIVVYGLNLQPDKTASISFKDYDGKDVYEYLLTAPNGNLKSQSVNLNGQTMKIGEGDSLPQLIPQKRKSVALLPPLSYGFFVIKDAKHPLC